MQPPTPEQITAFNKKNHDAFHNAAGTAPSDRVPPTPFQLRGGAVKNVGTAIKNNVKKVGKYLLTPTRNVNIAHDKAMAEMARKAKAGDYNK